MNTTAIGSSYERAATIYLEDMGLFIIEQNWRTRWCEVDIVAQDKDGVIHIVEVRYRASGASGDAVQSITPAKQRQLVHAARRWAMMRGAQYGIQIDIIAINGQSEILYIPNAVWQT